MVDNGIYYYMMGHLGIVSAKSVNSTPITRAY